MVGLTNRSEAELKAAVIDRLLAGAHVDDDAVLISEMTVANWSRRADVVLANGKLWAFEIKSEADSLARLPGQAATFRTYFEKFVIVAAARFEAAITAMNLDGVGLWIAEADGTLKQRVAPRQTVLDPEAYISLMTASELRRLLIANGSRCPADAPRIRLEDAAARLPTRDLAAAARDAVKCRHRPRHREFMAHKDALGTLGAMWTLRRITKAQAPTPKRVQPAHCALPEVSIAPNNPNLVHAPAGPILKRQLAN
ncbi:sce7726 family protein [Caulobacter radicis]|uniref:sce7726 family protein n=1 Tax=Caulobacter radicis TaxID=2172650 RepID=UPI001058090D|nr:sce7726 family protein [Caulobacter radicis]